MKKYILFSLFIFMFPSFVFTQEAQILPNMSSEEIGGILQERSKNTADTIRDIITERKNNILILSKGITYFGQTGRKEWAKGIISFTKEFKDYSLVRIIDPRGFEELKVTYGKEIKSECADVSSDEFFMESIKLNKDQILVSPLEINSEGIIVLRMSTPIFGLTGMEKAILSFDWDISEITNLITKLGVSDLIYGFIINHKARILVHPEKNKMLKEGIHNENSPEYKYIIRKMQIGGSGSYDYTINGEKYIIGFTFYPEFDWAIGVSYHCKENNIMNEVISLEIKKQDDEVKVSSSLEELENVGNNGNKVISVTFSSNDKYIDSGGSYETTKKWNTENLYEHPDLPPYFIAKLDINDGDLAIKAGEECKITLEVENKGKGNSNNLMGIIESPSELFNNKIFNFRKVEVGKSKIYQVVLNIPKAHPDKDIPIKIKWVESNDYIPDEIEAILRIKGLPKPEFIYNYQIIDDNSGYSVGNSDGRIQKGEAVDILLSIKNIGKVTGDNVKVEIIPQNEKGIKVHIKEAIIQTLKSNETKTVRLSVTVLKASPLDKLALSLLISEPDFGAKLEDKLNIVLDTRISPQVMLVRQSMAVKNEDVSVYGGAGDDTMIIAKLQKDSQLQVTGQLGDWFRINLPDGQSGWIKQADLSQISENSPSQEQKVASEPTIIKVYNKMPPVIAIASPQDKITIFQESINLAGVAKDDNSVVRVEIKVNGESIDSVVNGEGERTIKIEPEEKISKSIGKSVSIYRNIPLQIGKNIITITAYDNENLFSTETINVTREIKLSAIWSVVIGVSQFQDNNINLKYAHKDAEAFYEFLKSSDGCGLDDRHIQLLTNENATSVKIFDNLKNFLKQANKEDIVFIYLATHGMPDADGSDLYYLGHNSDVNNLMGTAISNTQIMQALRVIQAGKIVIFIDACHSGGTGISPMLMAKRDPTFVNRLVSEIAKTKDGIAIFSASSASGFSGEYPELSQGVFTYFMLEGLKGKANKTNKNNEFDNVVTIDELFEYVRDKVKQYTNGNQVPEVKGNFDHSMPLAIISH